MLPHSVAELSVVQIPHQVDHLGLGSHRDRCIGVKHSSGLARKIGGGDGSPHPSSVTPTGQTSDRAEQRQARLGLESWVQ